jgi:hypothetical protein
MPRLRKHWCYKCRWPVLKTHIMNVDVKQCISHDIKWNYFIYRWMTKTNSFDNRSVTFLQLNDDNTTIGPFVLVIVLHPGNDVYQARYILSPLENLEPYWFSRSKVIVTGSNFYPVPETCLNQTLNKPESCINQTLNKPETCINQTLDKPESCINQPLNKGKAWRIPSPKNLTFDL